MKISHYLEFEESSVGGIKQSVKNQRKAMRKEGIDYVTSLSRDADIWHMNFPGPLSLLYAVLSNLIGKKLVINVHMTREDFQESFRFSNILSAPLYFYLKFFYSRADLLITPSEYTADLMKQEYGFSESSVCVLTNGVDVSKLKDLEGYREEAREKYNLDGDVVFCVGTVFERKGVKDFVRTAEKFPDKEFVWFGKVFDERVVGSEARDAINNPPENVRFTGYVDDIRHAFAAGDVFFYPTKTENQGIPALEAAYCQKPVVMRDIPAFEEDFQSGENCVKGDSIVDFEQAIDRVIEDQEFSGRIVANAKSMVENHTLDAVGRQLKEIYQKLD